MDAAKDGKFERSDDWSSCVYFYLNKPSNELPLIDPVEKRVAGLISFGSPDLAEITQSEQPRRHRFSFILAIGIAASCSPAAGATASGGHPLRIGAGPDGALGFLLRRPKRAYADAQRGWGPGRRQGLRDRRAGRHLRVLERTSACQIRRVPHGPRDPRRRRQPRHRLVRLRFRRRRQIQHLRHQRRAPDRFGGGGGGRLASPAPTARRAAASKAAANSGFIPAAATSSSRHDKKIAKQQPIV